MAEEAIYLRDSLIPCVPVRQFVVIPRGLPLVAFPPPLRLWLARSTELSTRNLATDISTRVNNILIKKGYLEKHEDLMLQGNTEDIFAEANDSLRQCGRLLCPRCQSHQSP